MVGDFNGTVRVFNKDYHCIDTFTAGMGIRYIHCHDFVNDMTIIGCMYGSLSTVTRTTTKTGETSFSVNTIYEVGHTITNIRTAICDEREQSYYIICSDTQGFLYIFKGIGAMAETYKLVFKYQAH